MAERSAQAGFALSVALFALAWPGSPPRLSPCAQPTEAAARDGFTTEVVCVAPGDPGLEIRGPARRLFGLPIDLACAQAKTLETFKGIGPVLAQRIVEAREIQPFERVEDLLRVHGIGPKTLERLRDELSVSPVTARPSNASALSADAPGCPALAGD